jgi:hypothetical protein
MKVMEIIGYLGSRVVKRRAPIAYAPAVKSMKRKPIYPDRPHDKRSF